MSALGHGQGPGHATLIPRLRDVNSLPDFLVFLSAVCDSRLIAWKSGGGDVGIFSSLRGENEQFHEKCVVPE
jgi:hypothetical protein